MAPVAVGGTVLTTGLGSVTVGPEVASELWLFEFDFALVWKRIKKVFIPILLQTMCFYTYGQKLIG